MEIPLFKTTMFTLAAMSTVSFVVFLIRLFLVRSKMLQLQKQGLVRPIDSYVVANRNICEANCSKPMPPYNPIFGHLLIVNKIMSKLPKDAHPQYLQDQIRRTMPEIGPNYYVDTWPFFPPMLVVSSPSTLYQIMQEHPLPQHQGLRNFLRPLTGGLDLLSMNGPTWKKWRSIYNPGFSTNHLIALVPDIVRETLVFCDILQEHAERKIIFRMKPCTDNLAIDVIGKVVLWVSGQLHISDYG